MTLRNSFIGLLSCVVLLACGPSPGSNTPKAAPITYEDAPRRDGIEAILVALPASQAAKEALTGLRYEVEDDFDIVTLVIDSSSLASDFAKAVDKSKPVAIVLMNNPTLAIYHKYQSTAKTTPPAIAILSSFLSRVIGKLRNTGGIAYEVPAVTIFPSLRDYINRDVSRVGVLHRKSFSGFVSRQQSLAKAVNVELVSAVVSDKPTAKEVKSAVAKLRKQNVDTFWVLNDNLLLSPEANRGWLEGFNQGGKRLPVIVGVRPLINSKHHFGSFAILPSHEGIGSQTGEMLLDLADNDWEGELGEVQEPIAVEVVVDIGDVRKHFQLNETMVSSIDILVE